MASTMAAVAAHSKPPFRLPAVPRIRPPPIPKGTPGPNTLPISGPPPYPSAVWADGKWRNPNSMSALHKSKTISRQMEKALQHEVHGMNIYAYKHFSTNQVVYSLTNNMNENKILKQLIYHGKKTVPDEIRPDVWRPYFSIHFPKTPSGAAKGLKVYQELRELSMKRQLDPPVTKTHFMITKRVLDADGQGGRKYKHVRVPTARRLDKKTRAQRLMNQKASSVADVAAVLMRHASLPYTPAQQITSRTEEKKQLDEGLSSRASKRLAIIRGEEEEKAREIEERSSYLQHPPGNVVLDRDTQARISIEYEGVVDLAQEHGNDTRLGMHNAAKTATEEEVGAQVRYEAAFTEWKAKRAAAIEAVEKSMTETVDRQIAQMSEVEQAQIRAEMEVERQSLRQELDEKISQRQEAFRNERETARASFKSPPDWKQQLELHRMKNAHSAEMRDLRMDADRRTKWVGPYARVYESVINTEQEFDNQWAEIKPKLEADIEQEKATYSDPDYHNVEIRWADVRDGTYAREWPDSVTHLELQPKAVAMSSKSVKANNGILTGKAVSKTVHLFGSDEPAQTELDSILLGRYAAPHLLESVAARNRYERVEKEITAHFVNVFKRLHGEASTLHEQAARLEEEFQDADDLPLFYTAHDKIAEANGLLDSIMLTKDSDDIATVKEIALWLRGNVSTIDEEWKNAQWQRGGQMDKALSPAAQTTQLTLDPEGPEVGKARIEWINTAAELLQMEVENIDAFRAGFTSGNWRTHVKGVPQVERTGVARREETKEESPKKQGMWTRVKGLFGR